VAGEDCSFWGNLGKQGGNIAGEAIPIVLPVWVVWQTGSAMAAHVKGRDRATNGFCYGL
jgi:hypothetical protein